MCALASGRCWGCLGVVVVAAVRVHLPGKPAIVAVQWRPSAEAQQPVAFRSLVVGPNETMPLLLLGTLGRSLRWRSRPCLLLTFCR